MQDRGPGVSRPVYREFQPSRRALLKAATGLSSLAVGAPMRAQTRMDLIPRAQRSRQALLDEIHRRSCHFFYDQVNPELGLVHDRAIHTGREQRAVSSIAATGFGLSALCIADQQRYFAAGSIRRRVQATLEYLASEAPHEHGFFPHFLNIRTGERIWGCEYSSVDTAWLLCGVLHCRATFADSGIQVLADEIIGRVDWRWMLNGGPTLSHGWTPEHGFLPYRWDSYSELMAMNLLAVSTGTTTLPGESWHAWARPFRNWKGAEYIDSPAPLFVHQFSHAWFDFRARRDRYADYFANSRLATEAHQEYCAGLSAQFPWYSMDMWGITASESETGYVAWGTPAAPVPPDGTLVPCAAAGSMPFLPDQCATVLETMLERYGNKVWTRYGFVDAFHPGKGWYSPDIIGIDVGITLLMIENARTGSVWNAIMSTVEAPRAFDIVGLQKA